ncbi:hypothetical protein PF011_g19936 [Phytophthora fragariae]|uniref:Ubiquitin-like protease family profile domain-containing protein n=1 Tax=Phytophthora fragariae TaxID=53985 RepID=A0A6A3IXJ0_9STRA|nr:hypothetical protein PF003_g15680 [Phytophthora fragariae]KAE8986552.1 hypothetical protein PF011_g19936 [Phytophthora fragariae]
MTIATHPKISSITERDVIAQKNPTQFDAFSCGVFVCWMFTRHVAKGSPLDMRGRLLPKEDVEQHDEEEEKMAAPAAAGNDNEEEDTPPTQVAK